eukprot:scaffold1915_cov144-Amphora_coffeaeformis.AAC.8
MTIRSFLILKFSRCFVFNLLIPLSSESWIVVKNELEFFVTKVTSAWRLDVDLFEEDNFARLWETPIVQKEDIHVSSSAKQVSH